MTERELSAPERTDSAARFDFHRDGDRGCPNCGEVALAFDPGSGRARCRSCGESA